MIAALWSNSNWDDEKGSRKRAVDEIEGKFNDAVEAIEAAFNQRDMPEEEKLSDNNPFFAAAERGLAKVDARMGKRPPSNSNGNPDYMKDLDQAP